MGLLTDFFCEIFFWIITYVDILINGCLFIVGMCYTPFVSAATAAIEFGIAIFLFSVIADRRLRVLPYFVLFLGLYQLSEFLLCTMGGVVFARIGFAAFTMLPVLAAHLFYDLRRVKFSWIWYVFPLSFVGLGLFYPDFIVRASCELFYIIVDTAFFRRYKLMLYVYCVYYFIFPTYASFMFLISRRKTPIDVNRWKIRIVYTFVPLGLLLAELFLLYSAWADVESSFAWLVFSSFLIFLGVVLFLFSFSEASGNVFIELVMIMFLALLFFGATIYFVFPWTGYIFASVYCHFALLYSLAAILLVQVVQGKK
ncbi:MAG: hypothetical protein ACI83O_000752 [Patescibacteria group bacterium]|jgi:hypothetical protein